MNFDGVKIVTFDCYGTIIDWETGILAALSPLIRGHGARASDAEILRRYARLEAEQEGGVYLRYAEVLRNVVRGFARELDFELAKGEENVLVESLPRWPPFADSVEALGRLQERYRLAILSNIDDDLFALTRNALGLTFDWVVTAQQVRSYKPAPGHFERLLQLADRPKEAVVHCGQSPYHDIAPARALGLRSVWVRRRGHGATLPTNADADLTVDTLRELAQIALQ